MTHRRIVASATAAGKSPDVDADQGPIRLHRLLTQSISHPHQKR
jgi:hypothetical protein